MADITTTRQFVDGERGITAQKLNDIVGSSTIQPAFYSSKPTAPSADPTDIALILKAGAYAQVPISSLAGSATQAQIWDTRLRSYNAVGNPNFEVDQRLNLGTNPASESFLQDRWLVEKSGTMTVNTGGTGGGPILIPGTSFNISNSFRSLQLTAQQTSLGATDYYGFKQIVEGCNWRELSSDVTSITLLVKSDVANLKFAVSLRSPDATETLVKLCTVPSSGVWTLIQLPNIPVPSGGNFSSAAGSMGYTIDIILACGSTFMAPAADTWQNGNFLGAPGMSNWAASPVNTNFQIAFCQHEPGSLCTTLMDKSFSQNLDECLRYYCKSYPYTTKQGTANMAVGQIVMYASNASFPLGTVRFPKAMAKTPSVVVYDPTGGGSNNVRNFNAATAVAATAGDISDQGFDNVNTPSGVTVGQQILLHYAADTGL